MKWTTILLVGGILSGVLWFLKSGFWKLTALATAAISGFMWFKSRG